MSWVGVVMSETVRFSPLPAQWQKLTILGHHSTQRQTSRSNNGGSSSSLLFLPYNCLLTRGCARFLRDGESMIHTLTRLAFPDKDPLNSTVVNLGNVQEFRQVVSPNTPIWTHLVTNERQYGHLPSKAAIANET